MEESKSIKEEVLDFLEGLDEDYDFFDDVLDCEKPYDLGLQEDYIYEKDYGDFECFWGATRFVIKLTDRDYVIKIPFVGHSEEDYCKIEVENYKEAEAAGYGKFFAEEYFLTEFKNNYIYIQLRADIEVGTCMDRISRYLEDNLTLDKLPSYINADDEMAINSYIEEISSSGDNLPIEDIVVGIFEEDENSGLTEFIEDNCINDIHYGNIGFRDGRPLFIDYAGYRRQKS